ncbi:MAG TPA: Gfo/Idh/MocA family oxidoreductase [Dehalococcoidia bacterium]|nr:Gfo/Idh/MocA family oxidoreductase [Dehalococcoidia bacterium]
MAETLRVAVIGVGHYHALYPPYYLELLRKQGAEVVAVADPTGAVAEIAAHRCDAKAYVDYRSMVQLTRPDLVLALGRHVDMPLAFRYLVDAGVPFIAEKPWGVDAETVRELSSLAESRGAWVATPFSMRYSQWAAAARQMLKTREGGSTSHMVFRMIRPGVSRYVDYGSPWMLSKEEAGGGVLLNLGVHGFDLCRHLTGEEPEIVSSVVSNAAHGLEVEDYASVLMRTPSGALFHNEVSYTYPRLHGDDDERKLATAKALLRATPGGLRITDGERDEVVPPPDGYVAEWEAFIADCLGRLRRGEPPPNTPRDTARAVALVFEAYRMAEAS